MNPENIIVTFSILVVMAGSLPRNEMNTIARNVKNVESVEG
jgi:hypothetical protein